MCDRQWDFQTQTRAIKQSHRAIYCNFLYIEQAIARNTRLFYIERKDVTSFFVRERERFFPNIFNARNTRESRILVEYAFYISQLTFRRRELIDEPRRSLAESRESFLRRYIPEEATKMRYFLLADFDEGARASKRDFFTRIQCLSW